MHLPYGVRICVGTATSDECSDHPELPLARTEGHRVRLADVHGKLVTHVGSSEQWACPNQNAAQPYWNAYTSSPQPAVAPQCSRLVIGRAGVLALMLLVNPDLTATQLKEVLCLTADQIDKDNNDENGKWSTAQQVLTDGQLKALPLSLRNRPYGKWYGFGRVHALKAVRRAFDLRQT